MSPLSPLSVNSSDSLAIFAAIRRASSVHWHRPVPSGRREVGHRPAALGRDTVPDSAADGANDNRHREGAAQDASADEAL
jgi:hypothetical protein